jgi:hypothetical protein
MERVMISPRLPGLLGLSAGLWISGQAAAAGDLPELGLLLDSSGSVTAEDFTARNTALARALTNPWLLPAIESSPHRLALGIYQYSGPGQVEESLSWQIIENAADARAVASGISSMVREFAGGADVDSALLISSILTGDNPIWGSSTTLLILGDGGTMATGIGRDFALGQGVDRISAWVTGEPGDLDGYLTGAVAGDGSEALLFGDPGQFEKEFLEMLFRHFHSTDNTSMAATNGLGQAVLEGSRFAFSDINGRLARARTGADDPTGSPFLMKWPTGAKATVEAPRSAAVEWSAFGSVSGGWQDGAGQQSSLFGIPVLTQAAHELRYEAVTAGIEARFAGNWALGAALLGYHGDIDLQHVGDGDDNAAGGALYLSHRRALPWGGLTFHGDVMAGWTDHEIELDRQISTGIAHGETDASTQVFEFHLGVQRQDFGVVHGPEAGLNVLRGNMDAFRDIGAATALHPETDFSSTITSLGYQGAVRLGLDKIPLTLSARTAWEHEFDGTERGLQGSTLGSIARDTWVAGVGLRAAVRESVAIHLLFENRLAHETDAQMLKLGCDIAF